MAAERGLRMIGIHMGATVSRRSAIFLLPQPAAPKCALSSARNENETMVPLACKIAAGRSSSRMRVVSHRDMLDRRSWPPAFPDPAPRRAFRGGAASGARRMVTAVTHFSGGHDLVCMRDMKLQAVIGCNPDERDRLQDIIINVQLWTDLRANMQRHISQCDILEVQKSRADAPDWATHAAGELAGTVNYSSIAKIAQRVAIEGKFFTIEAMAQCIARAVIVECDVGKVQVTIDKPQALAKRGAAAAACQVTRKREDFFFSHSTSAGPPVQQGRHTAANALASTPQQGQSRGSLARCEPFARHPKIAHLSLGSNVGDGASQIQKALRHLTSQGDIQLLATSFMYESPAAYVTDQPAFTNAACKVATSLGPNELLERCKQVEQTVGREMRYRWGPREVDVDIVLYNGEQHSFPEDGRGRLSLEIPHIWLHERDFVLGPLCDMDPRTPHPGRGGVPVCDLLSSLLASLKQPKCALTRILPLRVPFRPSPLDGASVAAIEPGAGSFVHLEGAKARTAVMGVLNVTPDSFSDGGDHSTSVDAAVARIQQMVEEGADIIDIGGQSTRPGAEVVPLDIELSRVVPVIAAARAVGVTACISVDTFRAEVARQAVAAGADMINDVSGGILDDAMLACAAELMVPICLMHYRGDPASMQALAHYPAGGVLDVVKEELEGRVAAALRAGVPRWNIIVDPGVGFAKTAEQSLEALKGCRSLTRLCRPWSGHGEDGVSTPGLSSEGFGMLVGPSRKSFIGKALGEPDARSERRLWGTAAACTAAVGQGACIVRVHDVAEMGDVVTVADAIFRRGPR